MDKQYASDPIRTYRDDFEELDYENDYLGYQNHHNLNVLGSARQQYLTANDMSEHGIGCLCKFDAYSESLKYQKRKTLRVSGSKQSTASSAKCNTHFQAQRPPKKVSNNACVQVTENDPEMCKYNNNENHPHEFLQKCGDTNEVLERCMFCPRPLTSSDIVQEHQYDNISPPVAPYEEQDGIHPYRNKKYSAFPNNGSKMVNRYFGSNQTSFHLAPYSNRFQISKIPPVRQNLWEPQGTDSYTYNAYSNASLNGRDWRKCRPVSSCTRSYEDEIHNTRRTMPFNNKKVMHHDNPYVCEKCAEAIDMSDPNDRDWRKCNPVTSHAHSYSEFQNTRRSIPYSSDKVIDYDNRCTCEKCAQRITRGSHFRGPRSFSGFPLSSPNPSKFLSSRYYAEYSEPDSRYNTSHDEKISLLPPSNFEIFNLHTSRCFRPISEENMVRNTGNLHHNGSEDNFRNVSHECPDQIYKEPAVHSSPKSNGYRETENTIERNNTKDLYQEAYKEPSSTQNESDCNSVVNDDSSKHTAEGIELNDQKGDISAIKSKDNGPLSRDTNRKILKTIIKSSVVQEHVFENADKVLKQLKNVLIAKGRWQGD